MIQVSKAFPDREIVVSLLRQLGWNRAHSRVAGDPRTLKAPPERCAGGHQNDLRIAGADKNADEIHVFYRERHNELFRYLGQARAIKTALLATKPSQFEFHSL